MSAGRKPIEFVPQEKPVIDLAAVNADLSSLDQQRQAVHQQDARIRAIACQIGYQLPADVTDADLIQRDISANMRRSVEACLEVGRGLTVLKAACEHGQFMARLDVLGIDRKVAAKFMQSATKFANVSSTRHLAEAIGNQTKLFEMLVLDDEQIEELELTGQTGELKLDDVATMSVKDLRAKVRELRRDKAEQAAITTESKRSRDERINKLEDELAALKAKPQAECTPELIEAERLRFISDATMKIVSEIEAGLRSHFTLLEGLFPNGEVPNHARLAQQQALSQVIQSARALAGDFGITLKQEDLERPELLWLTQSEALFGSGELAGTADSAPYAALLADRED